MSRLVLERTTQSEQTDADRQGLVIVFTGDGKGKTTAALGMTLRAAGHRMRVHVIQFIKGTWQTGEMVALQALKPHVDLDITGKGFTSHEPPGRCVSMDDHRTVARDGLRLAKESLSSHSYDIVVLDEVLMALQTGLVEEEEVLALVQSRPPSTHLVLTGRGAPSSVVALADLVTEMRSVKHPYQKGTRAQRGVEF